MKKLIYLFVSLFVIFAINSCKRLGDDDGNLLNDMDANNGELTGPRFLYREIMGGLVQQEYHYDMLKMVETVGPKNTTKINYSGDRIYRIDHTKIENNDKITYSRTFNYLPNTNIVNTITENSVVQKNYALPTPPAAENFKKLYTITYNTDKTLQKIEMKAGKEVPGTTFEFTNYMLLAYTYDATKTNIEMVDATYGGIVQGVFDAPSAILKYNYGNYDDKKTPYSLLPWEYKLSVILDNPYLNYYLSKNNPKRIITNDFVNPAQIKNTLYTYDPQGYALSGFGLNWDYRPF